MLEKQKREEIINNIKQNNREWKVEKVLTFDGLFGNEPYKEWKEMLVSNDIKLEYEEDTIVAARGKHLVIIPNKMYRKSDFSIDEWNEVEQMLKQSKKSNQNEIAPKNSFELLSKKTMVWMGVALIVVILGIIVVRKRTGK